MRKVQAGWIVAVVLMGGASVRAATYEQDQYKRQGLNVVSAVVDGKGDAYLAPVTRYLETHPDDPESMFIMALLHTQRSRVDQAMPWVRRAVEHGMPVGRFIAGPRDLLGALHESPPWREFLKRRLADHPDEVLVHGPMVGSVTSRGAAFWVRTAEPTVVRVEVSPVVTVAGGSASEGGVSSQAATTGESDYTARLDVVGLRPDTQYGYGVFVEDRLCAMGRFQTAPPIGQPGRFSVGFGGGAGYTPDHERMWTTIGSHDLRLLLLLGDNVYIDDPTKPAVQRYCYYRRQSRPEWRRLVSHVPVYAIWDDHDFVTDDGWGGPAVEEPAWKRDVWTVFRQNWVNPAYGGGATSPGCWFDFHWGDVHFIMLDGRYYRDNPRSPNPSMLGPAQKAWLKKTLAGSTATFKVLISPVPWSPGAKPGSRDSWDGYADEREEIFDWIADRRIEGVILLAADRHRSDVWRIDRPGAYPLFEFESSRLTNMHRHGPVPGCLFSYNAKCSFGKLTFDTTAADPTVVYDIYSIDNERVHTFTVHRGQLEF